MKVVAQEGDILAVLMTKQQLAIFMAYCGDDTYAKSITIAREHFQKHGRPNVSFILDKAYSEGFGLGDFYSAGQDVLQKD